MLNKEKSLSASRVGCLGVLFVSVGEDYLHDPQGGVLNKEKSLSASRVGCLGVLFVSVGEDYLHDPQGGVLNKEKSLSASRVGCHAFLFLHRTFKLTFDVRLEIKKPAANATGLFPCSGGRIRTSDLWVMSPTSYHCSTPQYVRAKIIFLREMAN